jgi:hypothetical protein
MRRALVACLALVSVLGAGCGAEFDRPSELKGLRVLAVQKDKPYAKPGETVTLKMLWHDGSDKDPRRVQLAWIAGCFNPVGDLYYGCFEQLVPIGDVLAGVGTAPPGMKLALGDVAVPPDQPPTDTVANSTFSFEMTPDILDRPPPLDPTQPPYGISYVFFLLCAGELRPAASGGELTFPIACLDESGNALGPDDFVAGYSIVFAYEGFQNANPIITGFEFRGTDVTSTSCIDDACLDCIDGTCPGDEPFNPNVCGNVPCVDRCEDDGDVEKCQATPFKPIVDTSSAGIEIDAISAQTRGENLTEQMWINYYVERGGVKSDVRLLNDAVKGAETDYGTEFYAPKDPGPNSIWAVVHDNRGGMSWIRVPIVVQ